MLRMRLPSRAPHDTDCRAKANHPGAARKDGISGALLSSPQNCWGSAVSRGRGWFMVSRRRQSPTSGMSGTCGRRLFTARPLSWDGRE